MAKDTESEVCMYQSYVDLYGARLSVLTHEGKIILIPMYVGSLNLLNGYVSVGYNIWTHHTRDSKWDSNPTTLIGTPD